MGKRLLMTSVGGSPRLKCKCSGVSPERAPLDVRDYFEGL